MCMLHCLTIELLDNGGGGDIKRQLSTSPGSNDPGQSSAQELVQ